MEVCVNCMNAEDVTRFAEWCTAGSLHACFLAEAVAISCMSVIIRWRVPVSACRFVSCLASLSGVVELTGGKGAWWAMWAVHTLSGHGARPGLSVRLTGGSACFVCVAALDVGGIGYPQPGCELCVSRLFLWVRHPCMFLPSDVVGLWARVTPGPCFVGGAAAVYFTSLHFT